MIYTGMRSIDIPFLDGNIFKQVIMYCTKRMKLCAERLWDHSGWR